MGDREMNFIIIIMACILAYILTEMFEIAEGLYADHQLKKEQKKRLNNDIYKFKFKQLFYFMTAYYMEIGYTKDFAKEKAFRYVIELDQIDYIEEKYNNLREFLGNGTRRNKSCSK